MAERELDSLWVKQGSGLYVPFHEITGWSSASVGDYVAKGTDDTLQMVSAVTGGGASTGTGSPEGVVTAAVGAFYVQTDASTASDGVWYKQTGTGDTGWVQVTASDGTGGGGATVLYDSGALASAANSIDTGAAGIAGGYDVLEVFALLRTDEAVTSSAVTVHVNNDSGNNYDYQRVSGANTTASAGINLGTTGWALTCPGASQASGVFGFLDLLVPFYSATVAQKVGRVSFGRADTSAANGQIQLLALNWRSTAAITRMSFAAPATKNFIAGSHVIIYGR